MVEDILERQLAKHKTEVKTIAGIAYEKSNS